MTEHGVKPGEVSGWVAEEIGYKKTSIMGYLDEKYKHPDKVKGGKLTPKTAPLNGAEYFEYDLVREVVPVVDLSSPNGLQRAARALEREALTILTREPSTTTVVHGRRDDGTFKSVEPQPAVRTEKHYELAKALRAGGQEGNLVEAIAGFTTFSGQYVYKLLPDEYKRSYKSKPSLHSEQTFKQKPRKQTNDEEKLKTLYDKVEKSVFTGQGNIPKYISDAKSLGLNVEPYESEVEGFKNCLQDSLGRRYEDVKDGLNKAYKRSTELKKELSQQIETEKDRQEKVKEALKDGRILRHC